MKYDVYSKEAGSIPLLLSSCCVLEVPRRGVLGIKRFSDQDAKMRLGWCRLMIPAIPSLLNFAQGRALPNTDTCQCEGLQNYELTFIEFDQEALK
jgi:hypothetical protein